MYPLLRRGLATAMFSFTIAATSVAMACPQGIEMEKAWIKPAPQGKNTAAYFTLRNDNDTPLVLTGISTPNAMAEIHETKEDEKGVMRMRQMEKLEIAPNSEAVFAPGGKHVMLIGLKQELKDGDKVPLTFYFDGDRHLNGALVVSASGEGSAIIKHYKKEGEKAENKTNPTANPTATTSEKSSSKEEKAASGEHCHGM